MITVRLKIGKKKKINLYFSAKRDNLEFWP